MATTPANIVYIIIVFLPPAAAALNIALLREILHDKQETGVALLQVRNELRNAAQRSNQQFNLVKENIRDLRAEMQDNHETLVSILG